MLDIKRLKELAMGATDGPWFLTPNYGMKITKDRETICAFAYQDFDGEHYNCVNEAYNAVFIGSCDPRTILALIKRVEDAEAALPKPKVMFLAEKLEKEPSPFVTVSWLMSPEDITRAQANMKVENKKDIEIAELKAVLKMHHDWHQEPDTKIKLGDDWYDLDACYVDSTLEERTSKALSL